MQPYYEHNGITIYCGDCLEVLPTLTAADCVLVTDPPYGLAHSSGWTNALTNRDVTKAATAAIYGNASIMNDTDVSFRDAVLAWYGAGPALVFGSWKVARPAGVRQLLIWDKGDASGMGDLSIPWKPSHEEIYVLGSGFSGKRTSGVLRAIVPSRLTMGRLHANQKPVSLMKMLIQKCPTDRVVFDPFMGSGTTLVAAKQLGRRAIGIELDERYVNIAIDRLQQEILELI
jgi:DNA modification methylase